MAEIEALQMQIREDPPAAKLSLIRRPVPVGGFRYFIKERPRMTRWNERVGLIAFRMFGIKADLTDDFQTRFNEIVTQDVFPLLTVAQQILDEGWRWSVLSISEYNVIVYFVDLCNKLMTLSESTPFSESDFYKMHEALLRISARPDYQRLLIGALEKILITHRTAEDGSIKRMRQRIDSLQRFFNPERPSRSVFSLIRAYCMVSSRRFLDWDDLTRPVSSNWLRDDFYECSPKVLEAIEGYVRELLSKIERTKKNFNWLVSLRDISGIAEGKAPQAMVAYYEKTGMSWREDGEDFFMLVLSLAKRIMADLDRVLHSEYDVMTQNEKIIKARIVDDEILEQLFHDVSEVFSEAQGRYLALGSVKFAVSVFRVSDKPKELLPTDGYRTVLDFVNNMLSGFFRLGIELRRKREENSYRDSFYLTHMIVNPQEMRGRPVVDVLAIESELLLQVCGYFKSKEMIEQVRKIPAIEKRLKSLETEKERLDANGTIGELLKAAEKKAKRRN